MTSVLSGGAGVLSYCTVYTLTVQCTLLSGGAGVRPGHRGGSLPRLSLRRDQDQRHQRRGHARPVGVPGQL